MEQSKKVRIILILLGFIVLAIVVQMVFFARNSESDLVQPSYVVARDPTWFPFDFLDKDRQIAAFSDDLLAAVAQEQKISIKIYTATFASLFAGLNNRTYDAVLSPENPRDVFIERYTVSNPYLRFGPVLIVRRGSPVTSLSQLKGNVIGVLRGASLAFEQGDGSDFSFVPYDNLVVALQNLVNGSLDGVVVNATAAYAYTRGLYSDKLRVATAPLTGDGFKVYTLRDKVGETFIHAFNTGLETVKANGTYEKLLDKWGLSSPETVAPH